MAAVKGILVNDGGAPARIINFTAAAAISAGECCIIDTAGKAALASDGTLPVAGFALADAASGDLVSLVTGSGVVLYAITTAVTVGDTLMADTDSFAAIALETNATVDSLTKVLVK